VDRSGVRTPALLGAHPDLPFVILFFQRPFGQGIAGTGLKG
jgi:hypothetical protein